MIRFLLITQRKKPGPLYKRLIRFETDKGSLKPKIIVEDHINYRKKPEKLFYGGGFSVRYVPQSNYFESSDTNQLSHIFEGEEISSGELSDSKVKLQHNKIIIQKIYNFKSSC